MITPLALQDELNIFLRKEVADAIILKSLDFNLKKEIYKKPQVLTGYLIPKKAKQSAGHDDTDSFPYIVTRILKVEQPKDLREAFADVKIMFGSYCPGTLQNGVLVEDGSGYRDIWNLIEKTRLALFRQKIIAKKYVIEDGPFVAEFPEEQPYPYWEGWIMSRWNIGFVEPESDTLDFKNNY